MDAKQLFDNGELQGAIEVLNKTLRSHPGDVNSRYFLAELLCYLSDWERADKQLDMIGHQNPEYMPGIALFRQLLRAAEARQQFFQKGRIPEFIETPTDPVRKYLEASICLRERDLQQATALLSKAETVRRRIGGTCNDEPFDDLRDLDDQLACVFEVLAGNGKYYWFPFDCVESIEFDEATRPRDLLWRCCRIETRAGEAQGNVYMPAIYPLFDPPKDDQAILGRTTDWATEGEDAPVRGIGQRMFLLDESTIGIMDIQKMTLSKASSNHG